MDAIRERVEALRGEIAEIRQLNVEYSKTPMRHPMAIDDHARREQRLREIMEELRSMTEWKKL